MFEFTKVEALANDFIIINKDIYDIKKYKISTLCDRNTGIGADGVILYQENKVIFLNSDGSYAKTCGNGLRCFAKFLYLKNKEKKFSIRLQDTVILVEILEDENILINMGTFEICRSYFINYIKQNIKAVEVNLNNYHLVLLMKSLKSLDIKKHVNHINKKLKDVNVEFIECVDNCSIKMRVWERGVGETKACGSGAAASLIATNYLGLTKSIVNVEMPGGILKAFIKNKNVYISGTANIVYSGTYLK